MLMNQFPDIHGHRGARGNCPENTLTAVRYAIASGADGAEVDLCVTADDVIVVHHDLSLSTALARSFDGNWIDAPIAVRSLELETLKQYNVGGLRPNHPYSLGFPDQVSEKFASIPTLEEFIHCVVTEASDDFILNLELKGSPGNPALLSAPDDYVSAVLKAISRAAVTERCYLQSFDWHLIRLVREANPTLLTGLLTDQQPGARPEIPSGRGDGLWTDGLDLNDYRGSVPQMIKAAGSQVWSANFRDLTPALVDEARHLGLLVYVWTVNETVDMQRMIDWGVDTVTTDYPDRLIALRETQGDRR